MLFRKSILIGLLGLGLSLTSCGSTKTSPIRMTARQSVSELCSLWQSVPPVSYDSQADSKETISSAKQTNKSLKRNNVAREAFCRR